MKKCFVRLYLYYGRTLEYQSIFSLRSGGQQKYMYEGFINKINVRGLLAKLKLRLDYMQWWFHPLLMFNQLELIIIDSRHLNINNLTMHHVMY